MVTHILLHPFLDSSHTHARTLPSTAGCIARAYRHAEALRREYLQWSVSTATVLSTSAASSVPIVLSNAPTIRVQPFSPQHVPRGTLRVRTGEDVEDDPAATTFYSTALGALILSALVIFNWQAPTLMQWSLMAAIGWATWCLPISRASGPSPAPVWSSPVGFMSGIGKLV